MAGVIVNVAGTVLQAPLRVVPLAALLVVNNVVPKPLNGVLRFVLFLGQRRVRKLAGSRLRVEDLQLAGPLLGVIDSLAGPAAVLSLGRPLLRTLAPPVWRMGIFYRHMVPLLLGYFKTLYIEIPKAEKRGASEDETQEIWDTRHEIGADRMMMLMNDLKGFFLKLGQVFATKSDVLPPQYPRKLKALYDSCPASPFWRIKRTLEKELGRPLEELFAKFEPEALATATIAQVHVAYLHDGRKVAVKVQHDGVEKLMRQDIGNSLVVARLLSALKVDTFVDQVSVLEEYRRVVPEEFDFARERRLLDLVRDSLREAGCPANVVLPETIPTHCSGRVITETFIEGTSLSKLQHLVELHEDTWDLDPPPGASPAEMERTVAEVLEAFGHMIFTLGTFHSDPHPGNLVVMDGGRVGLLDFGEVKELPDDARLLYAKLVVALAHRDQALSIRLAEEAGLVITGVPDDFKYASIHVLFDTNMDMDEARMSPFDPDCPKDVRIPSIPTELFMVLRVCTIVRGILARFNCDVSAARVWEPYARRALERAGVEAPLPPKPAGKPWPAGQSGRRARSGASRALLAVEAEDERAAAEREAGAGPGSEAEAAAAAEARASTVTAVVVGGVKTHPLLLVPKGGSSGTVYDKMYRLAHWMRDAGLPHDRRALTPMAMGGVFSLADVAALPSIQADAAFKKFSPADRERCCQLAREAMAAHAKALADAEAAAAAHGRSAAAAVAGAHAAPAPAPARFAVLGEDDDDGGLLCSRPVRDEEAWEPSGRLDRMFGGAQPQQQQQQQKRQPLQAQQQAKMAPAVAAAAPAVVKVAVVGMNGHHKH